MRVNWTREQVLAALHLYPQLPFGQLHRGQTRILELASWMGRTPDAVAMKLGNIASLDPLITGSGRTGLAGASSLDKSLWSALQDDWDQVATEAAAAYENYAAQHGLTPIQAEHFGPSELAVEERPPIDEYSGVERIVIQAVRINQARFRRGVLAAYGGRCCMSGLADSRLLVASHIVPWAVDAKNRLNPQNGLCLSALHDKAFDQGLITVAPGAQTIRISRSLREQADDSSLMAGVLALDGRPINAPERFKSKDEFLAWHGQHFQHLI